MPTIAELEARDLPFVAADERGVITGVNARLEALIGWPAEHLVGKPVSILIPARLRDAHHLGFSRFLATGEPTLLGRPVRLAVLRGDGTEILAEHLILAERSDAGWRFGATIRPLDPSEAK